MLSVVFSTVVLLVLRPTTTTTLTVNSVAVLRNTVTSSPSATAAAAAAAAAASTVLRSGGSLGGSSALKLSRGTTNSVINYSTSTGKSSPLSTKQTITPPFSSSVISSSKMSHSSDKNGNESVGPTTNDEDQREASALQQRLKQNSGQGGSEAVGGGDVKPPLTPSVYIDPGRHKYVLISARYHKRPDLPPNDVDAWQRQYFVVSRKGAAYHRNAAEPFVALLEEHGGYQSIDITGGGRINYDPTKKQIDVYGYSYGFGLADHALSKSIIENDPRFDSTTGYKVTWSNDGY